MADVQQQLAALLGKRSACRHRKTDESPPRTSVIDVVAAMTGHSSSSNAAMTLARLTNEHPDVTANCSDVKFPNSRGRKGQKFTPACDVKAICEIVFLLPGRHAARVRRQAAELLVRYRGGSLLACQRIH